MKVLLVEDMAGFAVPIRHELEAQGHKVTWIIGATRIDGDTVTGIKAGRHCKPLKDNWKGGKSRLVELKLSDFHLALVDGGLIGPVKYGVDFVRALKQANVATIAISGAGAGNPPLIEAGAVAGIPKEYVVLALRANALSPMRVLAAPTACKGKLDEYSQEVRREVCEAREHGEHFKYGYPALDELHAA